MACDSAWCDNFFMDVFGVSYLNRQYPVSAAVPKYPDADKRPAKTLIAEVEGDDPRAFASSSSRLAGEGETVRTNHHFRADAAAGATATAQLYKPQGNLNMHGGLPKLPGLVARDDSGGRPAA